MPRVYTPEQRAAQRARSKHSYAKNRSKVLARTSAYQKTEKSKAWFRARMRDPKQWSKNTCYQLRYKAKELGLAFDLTPADIIMPAVCPFTELPFDFSPTKHGKPSDQSPSVDRIKPANGYVRGNVRVISMVANRAKNNITDPEVFRRLYEDALLWALA